MLSNYPDCLMDLTEQNMRMKIYLMLLSLIIISSFSCTGEREGQYNVYAEVQVSPGNITVTPDNRVIVSMHQFFEPEFRLVEVTPENQLIPFPNEQLSRGEEYLGLAIDAVLGIQADADGIVWMLDNGLRSEVTPKLIGWNTVTGTVAQVINLGPPVTPPAGAFVNDLAVDLTNNFIYIADPSIGANAALIVVDISDGASRRVLEGHESVIPEDIDLIIDDRPIRTRMTGGNVIHPRVGVSPIALDSNDEWLYYGPMHGTSLYRVRTADLRNPGLSHEELAGRVERFGDKPICDGITIDKNGNIYLGDLANNAIGIISPSGKYEKYIRHPSFSWVDAFAFGADGYIYTVANQLHRSAVMNAGEDISSAPFYIFSFHPKAEGIVGR
jgi:sugar lactone lactonase YvrE